MKNDVLWMFWVSTSMFEKKLCIVCISTPSSVKWQCRLNFPSKINLYLALNFLFEFIVGACTFGAFSSGGKSFVYKRSSEDIINPCREGEQLIENPNLGILEIKSVYPRVLQIYEHTKFLSETLLDSPLDCQAFLIYIIHMDIFPEVLKPDMLIAPKHLGGHLFPSVTPFPNHDYIRVTPRYLFAGLNQAFSSYLPLPTYV